MLDESKADPGVEFKQKARRRFYRALNYLTIYLFVLIVYGGAIVTDFALFQLILWLIAEDATKYPLVALWLDMARIILAILLVIFALVHGIFSTVQQFRMDWGMFREDEGI
jgi:uncharacterized Tic20 family protein